MNEKIKALASAIEEKEEKFMDAKKLQLSDLARMYLHELDGLKEAFRIITDESYMTYWLRINA